MNKPGSILPRYPVQLIRFFQVLADPDHNITKIDAAYERPDSNIVMFVGNNTIVKIQMNNIFIALTIGGINTVNVICL